MKLRNSTIFSSLILFAFLLFVSPQGASAEVDPGKITDFPTFFSTFQKAVKARDRDTIRRMLSEDVSYTVGRGFPGDPRDAALKQWGDLGDWDLMEADLSQGYRYDSKAGVRGAMVSPPNPPRVGHFQFHFNRVEGYWRVMMALKISA